MFIGGEAAGGAKAATDAGDLGKTAEAAEDTEKAAEEAEKAADAATDAEKAAGAAGKAAKAIPEIEYQSILKNSIHNADAGKVMLGKYDGGGPTSYITKAGKDYTYFSMGDNWNAIESKYGYTDDDMFDLFNKPFLDKEIGEKRTFYFSHDPKYDKGALGMEYKYLLSNGYKYDAKTMSAMPIK